MKFCVSVECVPTEHELKPGGEKRQVVIESYGKDSTVFGVMGAAADTFNIGIESMTLYWGAMRCKETWKLEEFESYNLNKERTDLNIRLQCRKCDEDLGQYPYWIREKSQYNGYIYTNSFCKFCHAVMAMLKWKKGVRRGHPSLVAMEDEMDKCMQSIRRVIDSYDCDPDGLRPLCQQHNVIKLHVEPEGMWQLEAYLAWKNGTKQHETDHQISFKSQASPNVVFGGSTGSGAEVGRISQDHRFK